MKLSLKQKLITVLLFLGILLIWMLGWSLYWIGDSQTKDRRPDESYWTWYRRTVKKS